LFQDDQEVVRAVRDFAHASANKKADNRDLLTIFRAICRNLKIRDETITNADFETAFNIRDGNPIPVALTVAHGGDSSQPQVVVFGHRPPNSVPFTIAILDATAVQQLQQPLQQHLGQAQAATSKQQRTGIGPCLARRCRLQAVQMVVSSAIRRKRCSCPGHNFGRVGRSDDDVPEQISG
jgi:hypothetical protein